MTAEFHKANRQRLYAEMKDGSAAVVFSRQRTAPECRCVLYILHKPQFPVFNGY